MCCILIVEDNSFFRYALKDILMTRFPALGIEEASNADEALSKLHELQPMLMIVDINMPGKNGLELTRIVKSTNSGVEVILLTSYDTLEYREAALQSGASHFFTKGDANADDIAAAVESTLETKVEECGV